MVIKEQELKDIFEDGELCEISAIKLLLNGLTDKQFELIDRYIEITYSVGFRLGVAEEKAKHEKFVEELRSELLDFVFPDLMEKKKINEIIDKLSEKYK